MAKTPVLETSFVATSARLANNLEATDCLSSHCSATAFAIADFVIAFLPLAADFIGAILSRGRHEMLGEEAYGRKAA